MSLKNSTTIPFIGNETVWSQQNDNSTCIFVVSPAERISQLYGYLFILLGSFFGNFLIIIVVYKHRDLRKTINYFIVNMAVSVLLFPFVVMSVHITALVTNSGHWHVSGTLGSIFCKLFYFGSSASLLVSV